MDWSSWSGKTCPRLWSRGAGRVLDQHGIARARRRSSWHGHDGAGLEARRLGRGREGSLPVAPSRPPLARAARWRPALRDRRAGRRIPRPLLPHRQGTAGPVALHAAAFEPRISGVSLGCAISSWSEVVRTPLARDQLSNAVPGHSRRTTYPTWRPRSPPGRCRSWRRSTRRGSRCRPRRSPWHTPPARTPIAQGARGNLTLRAGLPRQTRQPLLRALDLAVGETQTVTLGGGKSATVKLIAVDERRDPIRLAVREAKVASRGQRHARNALVR